MPSYAISNVPRRVVYAASGTGPYNFNFEIIAATDVAVYRDDTLLTLTTNYTVTINANGTGYITLTAAPTGATQIAIVGARAIQRTSDFVTGGDFFANTVNDELDSLTIFAQQNAEAVNRALIAPQTDPTNINMTLPRKSERANKYLAFDADGNPKPGDTAVDVELVATIADDINSVSAIDTEITAVAGIAANVTTVAGVAGNVATVAGIAANVTTVAGIQAAVTSVAADATDIGAVAAIAADVGAVADIAADVTAVAGVNAANLAAVAAIDSNVSTVAGVAANVTTVAGISANVTSVAGNSANINTVAGIGANVTTVAGIAADVTAVAGVDAADLSAVAAIDSDVTAVAGIAGNVTTVAGISSNVSTVAGASTNIGTVATNIANVNSVAGISGNVTSVAGNATNINNVAGSIANVNTVATNLANVNTVAGVSGNVTTVAGVSANVSTVATNVANVNTVASGIANVNTVAGIAANVTSVAGVAADVTAVAANLADVSNFADVYIGPKTSNPSARNDSSALQAGDLYFNTVVDEMRVYDGSTWVAATSSPDTIAEFEFTATAGQTTYSPAGGYRVGFTYVWVNGVMLADADITATDGNTITFASALSLNDEVRVITFKSIGSVAVGDITDLQTTLDAKADGAVPTSSVGGKVRLKEATANGTNYVEFQAPASISSNVSWTLPGVDGSNGQVLQTNGSGTLSWLTPSGMVYPGAGIAVSTGSAWGASLSAPTGAIVGTTDTQTLTNKTIALGSNTVSGTLAQFNTAVTDADLASTGANTFTSNQTGSDNNLIRWNLQDYGYLYYNSGTTNALNYENGSHQRWAPNTGAQTLSITNWPPSGNLGELLIEGVNLGAATITWPTINWIKSDGTTTTTFSSNGVTLQSSGTDWVLLWTRDAGTTIYGKIVR